ncbi:hypothetical protein Bca52824_017782 [Brassica carinata]|uniref:Uncharacterized protein n=1 Tax=Brassica carinata TaxID=52824 RepID=A0A8X7VNU0_BRACI|nr:hypothetical protein Bca52824_017782 [Brassica carinata]
MCHDPNDIFIGGRCRSFFEKCLNVGNIDVVLFEILHLASRHRDLEAAVALLEQNVPIDVESTLTYGVLNVCLGDEVKASEAFQQFIQHHDHLHSERVRQMCNELEWKLSWYHPEQMDTYANTLKYPNDKVIKEPDCAYDHDPFFDRFCNACNVFWTARNVCRMILGPSMMLPI